MTSSYIASILPYSSKAWNIVLSSIWEMKEEYLQKLLKCDLILIPFFMLHSTWSNGWSFATTQSWGIWGEVSYLSPSCSVSSFCLLVSSLFVFGGESSLGMLSSIKFPIIRPETS